MDDKLIKDYTALKLEECVPFGRYKNTRTLQSAIETDPGYIGWLISHGYIFNEEVTVLYLKVKSWMNDYRPDDDEYYYDSESTDD